MFTHNLIMRSGRVVGIRFSGTGQAVEYGRTHRGVVTVETIRGTVEYGQDEDGQVVNGSGPEL